MRQLSDCRPGTTFNSDFGAGILLMVNECRALVMLIDRPKSNRHVTNCNGVSDVRYTNINADWTPTVEVDVRGHDTRFERRNIMTTKKTTGQKNAETLANADAATTRKKSTTAKSKPTAKKSTPKKSTTKPATVGTSLDGINPKSKTKMMTDSQVKSIADEVLAKSTDKPKSSGRQQFDAAIIVTSSVDSALNCKAMCKMMEEEKLYHNTTTKTPWGSLWNAIIKDTKSDSPSFEKADRGVFTLTAHGKKVATTLSK